MRRPLAAVVMVMAGALVVTGCGAQGVLPRELSSEGGSEPVVTSAVASPSSSSLSTPGGSSSASSAASVSAVVELWEQEVPYEVGVVPLDHVFPDELLGIPLSRPPGYSRETIGLGNATYGDPTRLDYFLGSSTEPAFSYKSVASKQWVDVRFVGNALCGVTELDGWLECMMLAQDHAVQVTGVPALRIDGDEEVTVEKVAAATQELYDYLTGQA